LLRRFQSIGMSDMLVISIVGRLAE